MRKAADIERLEDGGSAKISLVLIQYVFFVLIWWHRRRTWRASLVLPYNIGSYRVFGSAGAVSKRPC